MGVVHHTATCVSMTQEGTLVKIPCLVQPTVAVTLPQSSKITLPGHKKPSVDHAGTDTLKCLVFDVKFDQPASIDCIAFQNFYTSSVTIKWLAADSQKTSAIEHWKVCLLNFELMKNCHCEQGSQDVVVFGPDHIGCELRGVGKLRVIMKQPSCHWREYGVHGFSCYSLTSSDVSNPS